MLVLFLFSTQGCHKDVISEQDTHPATSDLVANFVSDSYFAQANKYYKPSGASTVKSRSRAAQVDAVKDFFISNTSVVLHLVNTIGYPVWREAITSENNGDELLILPFSKLDTNRIDAVMLVHRVEGSDSMYFKMIRRDALHTLPRLSSLTLDESEKYSELSREFATTMVLYFEYAIFTEVDCDLANNTFHNPLNESNLETRGERCYWVEYIVETQYWTLGVNFVRYDYSRYSYRAELICNQIIDPGAFAGSGGPIEGNNPGGNPGSGNNNNENNSGPTLADCRQSNPEVLKRIIEMSSQKLVSPCHNGRSVNLNWNFIENELCKNNKYSQQGLEDAINQALGGMAVVDLNKLDNLSEIFTALGITSQSDKLKLISGSLCGEDQWSMPPIDWETSSCDQIFSQLLKAIRGQHLYVNCFGGSAKFDLSRYFTNMGTSKTCGQSTFVTSGGITIKGSFDLDFTLSANPSNSRYLANGYLQNQGVTYGSGQPLESYIMFGPNSNAPLIMFGITESTDAEFIKFINPPCPPK